ncbi:hypothetical protein SKAU_G00042540 [Synaphobranchus kaupii]|uniref:Uncharacterized protein n=1 Tax=Synaphobranchus kaupii TaxID=118154 RepID=A0A9Q1G2E9_SYNKA|nr:hypothetical protein SKAU_G00042540 [Synaphobranchus kaupii]
MLEALDDPPVNLSLSSGLKKVGVFVDYEEGSQLRRAWPAGRRRDPNESGWSLALAREDLHRGAVDHPTLCPDRTKKELDQKILKLQREVNTSKNSASAINLLHEELKATFHQMQQESVERPEVNCKTTEAERQRSKTMIGNLKHELAVVLDICKRKEQRLVAMAHRSEIWEEGWTELAVKKLSAMEGQCERKERELRAMVELFQEREDQLAAMAFSLQEKEEKMVGLKQLCQEKAENMATLQKVCHKKDERLAAVSAMSQQQEAVLQEKITEELAQQMESNKLKERVSVLEAEMEEKNIILMAQEEERRATASLRKKLTEVSSELAALKRSVTSSTRSLPTAQEIIGVEGSQLRRAWPAVRRRDPSQSGWRFTPRDSRPPSTLARHPGRLPIPFSFALIPLYLPPYDSLCVAERMIAEEWRVGEEEVGEVRGTEDRDGDGDTDQHCDRWRG